MANLVKQYSAITSGTITASNTQQDVQIIHNAVSLAVTMTIAFPTTPIDGQVIRFCSVLGVTTLTLSAGVSILGTLNSLAAMGFASYMYDINSTKWIRIG